MTASIGVANTNEIRSPRTGPLDVSTLLGHGLSFVLGAISFMEFPVVGRLFATEVLLVTILFGLLPFQDVVLRRPATKVFLSLAMVWLLGQLATDIIRGSDFTDSAKGSAKVVFTVINLLGLYFLLDRHAVRFTLYLSGLSVGQLVGFFVKPNAGTDLDPWKWGLGWPATFAAIAIAHFAYQRGRHILSTLVLGLIASVHLYMGFRALALVCFVTGCLVLYCSYGRSKTGQRAGHPFRVLFLLALAGLGFAQLYEYLASSGALGVSALAKYEDQSAGEYGVLLGGRSETFASLQAIEDSPLIGHGTGAKDEKYADLLFASQYEHGYRNIRPQEDDSIPSHSHLLGAWVEAGVLGVPFWAWSLVLIFRCLMSAIASPQPQFVLVVFSCTLLLWTIAFSPYTTEMRFIETFFLLVVMTYMDTEARVKTASPHSPRSGALGIA